MHPGPAAFPPPRMWALGPLQTHNVYLHAGPTGHVSLRALLLLQRALRPQGLSRSLNLSSSLHSFLGLPSFLQGQHLGPYFSHLKVPYSLWALEPHQPPKHPHPSPHPPAFISMQAQAAQTQGDCSSCMLRVGGWEQAAHTPWQAQATGRLALPRPVSPDRLCPPSLLPSLPPSPPASITIAPWH